MSAIHPTAIIEPGAKLAAGARIGPYCHVGPRVELGEEVELVSHVVVAGRTSIGAGTRIFPFASIGHQPQDLKYQGEDSALVIGKRNIIREHVTMNPGTTGGGMVTRTGDGCLFMASVHIGHDCIIGNQVIMADVVKIQPTKPRFVRTRDGVLMNPRKISILLILTLFCRSSSDLTVLTSSTVL